MRAFTFIEVILVVAIILLVGVVSFWFTTNFFFEQQTVLAAQVTRAALGRANMYALSGKADSNWGVTQVGNDLILFAGSTYAGRDATLDETIPLSGTITLVGLGEIIFTRPTGITIPVTFQVTGSNSTINLSIDSEGAVTGL